MRTWTHHQKRTEGWHIWWTGLYKDCRSIFRWGNWSIGPITSNSSSDKYRIKAESSVDEDIVNDSSVDSQRDISNSACMGVPVNLHSYIVIEYSRIQEVWLRCSEAWALAAIQREKETNEPIGASSSEQDKPKFKDGESHGRGPPSMNSTRLPNHLNNLVRCVERERDGEESSESRHNVRGNYERVKIGQNLRSYR